MRLVAATNRDLGQTVAAIEFRSDLYYRLNVSPICIPPLRERREDIPLLVSHFVQKFARQMQKNIEAIPAATMKGLTAWAWPGNRALLTETKGRRGADGAAARIMVNRTALLSRMKKFGIDPTLFA